MSPRIDHRLLSLAEAVNWNCLASIVTYGEAFLRKVWKEEGVLRSLLEAVVEDERLIGLCERYDFFNKIVLFVDPSDRFRLRLSVFTDVESNRPHFHRWSYGALVIRNGYEHSIFGNEEDLKTHSEIKPLFTSRVRVGDFYALHHSLVHAVRAEPGTVSLLLQGPPQKEKFLVIDQKIGRSWWEYGQECETMEERERKLLGKDRLLSLIDTLGQWHIP